MALVVGIACGSPSHPGEIGSEYVPLMDAGPDAGPLVLAPVVAKSDDPTTCAEAAATRSYVGCDYWPTVVANTVWSIFDFAVVVANAGVSPADVTVTGPGGVMQSQTVASNGLAKFYLPWVPALKGPDSDVCGEALPLKASVFAAGSAYHLVSSVPVTVYQFNALEYEPMGGPAGKDWSQCPGRQQCNDGVDPPGELGCFSFTNDSSLLLPSTAMTGHYRVTGYPGATVFANGMSIDTMGGYFAITATVDGTHVKVQLPSSGQVLASQDSLGLIPEMQGGGELSLSLDAGDVAEVVGTPGAMFDLSGALVAADQPVQVIAGTPCSEVPSGTLACDHLEQSVFPAETLGKRYIVAAPTGPSKDPVGRDVRIYGNVDGTVLTFVPSMPAGCQFPPVVSNDDGGIEGGDDGGTTGTGPIINAGQVVDCGIVTGDFEVTGTNEFSVGSFMQGGSAVDPNAILGDPSESLIASVEQFRTKYVFLAPTDYSENFVDVVAPVGATVVLDGAALKTTGVRTTTDGYVVVRISLNGVNVGAGGAHVLAASAPVGAQVLGYGAYTSYQYPAGLNLKAIAPPPPDPP